MTDTSTWFLLYGGESVDGSGAGVYDGRTTDKQVALTHYRKVQSNPYSTGSVRIITDTQAWVARCEHDIDASKRDAW